MAVLPGSMPPSARLASRATSDGRLSTGAVIAIVIGSIFMLLLLSLCICLFRCGKAIRRTKKRISNRWRKSRGVLGEPYVGKHDQWPLKSKIYDDSLFSDSGLEITNVSNVSLPVSTHYTHVRYPDLSHQPTSVVGTCSGHTLTPILSTPKSRRLSSPSVCSAYPPPTCVHAQATSSNVTLQYESSAVAPKQFPNDVKRILGLDDASFLKELPYYDSSASNLIAAPTHVGPRTGRSTLSPEVLQKQDVFKPHIGGSIFPASVATSSSSGSSNALSKNHGYDFELCPHDGKTDASINLHLSSVNDSIVLTRDYLYHDTNERPPTRMVVREEKFMNWDGENAPRMFADTWDVDCDLNPEHFAHIPVSKDIPSDPRAPNSWLSMTEQQEVTPPLFDIESDNNIYVPVLETETFEMDAMEAECIQIDRQDTMSLSTNPGQSADNCNSRLLVQAKSICHVDAIASSPNETGQEDVISLLGEWHTHTMMPPRSTPRPRFDSVITSKEDSNSIASDSTFDNACTSQYDITPGYASPATTGSQTSLVPEYIHSLGHLNDLSGTAKPTLFESFSKSPVLEIIARSTPLSRSTTTDSLASASEPDEANEFSAARMSSSTSLMSNPQSIPNEADILSMQFRCNNPHCDKSYRTQGLLSSHIRRTHERRYPCPKCDIKNFGLKADLKRHMRSVHGTYTNKFQCPKLGCKGEFGRKDNFQRHLKKCSKDDSQCEISQSAEYDD
ncbi:hypothetical protein J1614_010103 [Plenodomus biglobosus]|nr:hypothetical protein J1614_010103 [Plenodomus biglobosus]